MTIEEKKEKLTNIMASFIGHTAVHLPDDVVSKLRELRDAALEHSRKTMSHVIARYL